MITNCNEQKRELLEDMPVSLTYEIAKPSAESTPAKAQAKAEVLAGDIATLKEYRERIKELEKQAEAERKERERLEAENEEEKQKAELRKQATQFGSTDVPDLEQPQDGKEKVTANLQGANVGKEASINFNPKHR